LPVDPDAVLAAPVAFESFKPIPRRNSQRIEYACRVQLFKFPRRQPLKILGPVLRKLPPKDLLGLPAPERLDHRSLIPRADITVKR